LKTLGWTPRFSLEETLSSYVAWLHDNFDAKHTYCVEADKEMRSKKVIMKASGA
jgi:hypothetical protein